MVQAEHDVALQDTDRLEGRAALVNNVKAAVALAGAVRSTLGPRGLDKMLVSDDGNCLVTNDGVTVIEAAKVEHPTARLLISASSSQDKSARDGTTSTVILTAELLQNSLELVRMGIHPSVVINGFLLAEREAISELDRVSRKADSTEELKSVISTTLAGKIGESLASNITEIAFDAANLLSDEKGGEDLERLRVKRLQVSGGSTADSRLVNGLMIAKTRVDISTPSSSDGGIIAILDGGLENAKLEMDAEIEVSSPGVLKGFHDRSLDKLREEISHLSSLGVDLLIVREGISDDAIPMLTEAGITSYRRFEREDLERLSKITGTRMVRRPIRISEDDLGRFTSRREETVAGITHSVIEGSEGGALTVVIRGTSPQIREEAVRAFDDAMGVSFRVIRDSRIIPGGGAIQTHLARHLRSFALGNPGREQLAIEGYAAALEVIPRTLAENAGLDPIDVVLDLSAAQTSDEEDGHWIGLDAMTGRRSRMDEMGILDPLFVTRHSISGSTEAAISVLRINDVLWAKQDPTTPEWNEEEGLEE